MPAYMQLNGIQPKPANGVIPGTMGEPQPRAASIQSPFSGGYQPGQAAAGGLASALPQPTQTRPPTQAQAPRPTVAPSLGVNMASSGPLTPAQVSARQQAAADASRNLRLQAQGDADADRARQTELDMTTANQLMANDMGGRTAGQYGYVYPPGGGSGGSGNGGNGGGNGGGGLDLDALIAKLNQGLPTIQPPQQVNLAGTPPPQVPLAEGMFAHAKDVSGRVGNKALDAFRSLMTKRGMSDSGLEAEGEANILGQVATQQSDAEYDQANLNNSRQWDANKLAYAGQMDQNATGYQGSMGQNAMGYNGGIQQRGQDIQALLNLINLSSRY